MMFSSVRTLRVSSDVVASGVRSIQANITKGTAITAHSTISTRRTHKAQLQEQLTMPTNNLATKIEAYPQVCLQDVPTKLGAVGLKPIVPVTFKLTTHDVKGVEVSNLMIKIKYVSFSFYQII